MRNDPFEIQALRTALIKIKILTEAQTRRIIYFQLMSGSNDKLCWLKMLYDSDATWQIKLYSMLSFDYFALQSNFL